MAYHGIGFQPQGDRRFNPRTMDKIALFNTSTCILEKLRELKPQILQGFKVKEIQLFGSYVRNEQKADSDIDLLIDFEEDADLFDLSGLGIFLEEQFNCSIDLVPKCSIRVELRETILKDAILI